MKLGIYVMKFKVGDIVVDRYGVKQDKPSQTWEIIGIIGNKFTLKALFAKAEFYYNYHDDLFLEKKCAMKRQWNDELESILNEDT
jgi:hypothetical protein